MPQRARTLDSQAGSQAARVLRLTRVRLASDRLAPADGQAAAGDALRTQGVARLNGCVSAAACAELREHALRLRRATPRR
eukprot:scaffold92517_cov33-Phaeocystis_antarctica.AAC.1